MNTTPLPRFSHVDMLSLSLACIYAERDALLAYRTPMQRKREAERDAMIEVYQRAQIAGQRRAEGR